MNISESAQSIISVGVLATVSETKGSRVNIPGLSNQVMAKEPRNQVLAERAKQTISLGRAKQSRSLSGATAIKES